MSDDDVRRVLVRAVLEPEFRDLVRRAPDEAFGGLDIDDDDKAALREGGPGMLRLLARALGGDTPAAPAPDAAPPPPATSAAAPVPVALAPIALQLQIQPYAVPSPEGLRVTCAVTVQAVAPQQQTASPAPAAPRPTAWTAWDHDLDSAPTRAAAAAVRSAAPQERAARIADLLRSMTSRERIGGGDAPGRA